MGEGLLAEGEGKCQDPGAEMSLACLRRMRQEGCVTDSESKGEVNG